MCKVLRQNKLAEILSNETNTNIHDVEYLLNTLFNVLSQAMLDDYKCIIRNFGVFKLQRKLMSIPNNRYKSKLPTRREIRKIKFKPSSVLKRNLNDRSKTTGLPKRISQQINEGNSIPKFKQPTIRRAETSDS